MWENSDKIGFDSFEKLLVEYVVEEEVKEWWELEGGEEEIEELEFKMVVNNMFG